MLSNNQIKQIKLLKNKKYRKIYNRFVVEGKKNVNDIILNSYSDWQIDIICATKQWIEKNNNILKDKKINVTDVSKKELQSISCLKTPDNVLAVVKIPCQSIDIQSVNSHLTLMLDEIKDPGNLGTIIRIADWFGFNNIICSNECVDVYNPKVVQASMGSITRVNIFYTDLYDFLKKISSALIVYGSCINGENIYTKKFAANGIVIIGNESNGISKKLLPLIKEKIYIPSFSSETSYKKGIDSLNAAVATGIICSEFRRQNAIS
jgi:TrmH family RNA methyltransferase